MLSTILFGGSRPTGLRTISCKQGPDAAVFKERTDDFHAPERPVSCDGVEVDDFQPTLRKRNNIIFVILEGELELDVGAGAAVVHIMALCNLSSEHEFPTVV